MNDRRIWYGWATTKAYKGFCSSTILLRYCSLLAIKFVKVPLVIKGDKHISLAYAAVSAARF